MAIGAAAAAVASGAATTAQTMAAAAAGPQIVAVPVNSNNLPQARLRAATYCSNFGKAAAFKGIRQQHNGDEIALFACV